MKILNRGFTLKERLLLLLLCLVLVGLAYYQFVDQPVRKAVASAEAEAESLTLELKNMETQLTLMHRMRDEVEDITGGGAATEMGSYNNSKTEIALLNDILNDAVQYSITFANVTRDGDQIRRSFTLSFTAEDYETMETILKSLCKCHYRCLISDLRCSASRAGNVMEGAVSVNATATFYETMVGGTPDAGLPQNKAAAK